MGPTWHPEVGVWLECASRASPNGPLRIPLRVSGSLIPESRMAVLSDTEEPSSDDSDLSSDDSDSSSDSSGDEVDVSAVLGERRPRPATGSARQTHIALRTCSPAQVLRRSRCFYLLRTNAA